MKCTCHVNSSADIIYVFYSTFGVLFNDFGQTSFMVEKHVPDVKDIALSAPTRPKKTHSGI